MADEAKSGGKAKSTRRLEPVEVVLEHSRWRHFGWALFALCLGAVLLVKLGTVGQLIGVALVLIGGYHGYKFVRTLLKPAGTILVTAEQIELPMGLCQGKVTTLPLDKVRHVFVLRRAVPWTTTAPILVIEANEHAYLYPLDWFGSESDQRRVAQAIQNHQERHTSA